MINELKNKCNKNLIIKSKIALSRNIRNNLFSAFLSAKDAIDLATDIEEKIISLNKERFKIIKIREELREYVGKYLENGLITSEFFNNKEAGEFLYDEECKIVVMLNEGNHLKLSAVENGLNLKVVYERLLNLDNQLDELLDIAFDENLGYLTLDKDELGTGIKVSVIMHLPLLRKKEMLDELETTLKKLDISIKSIYGTEKNNGEIYEISNKTSLGLTEEDVITNIEAVANEIILREKKLRDELIKNENEIEDLEEEIFRAYGILANSNLISFEEALELISKLRLGIEFDFIKDVSLKNVDGLIEKIQYYSLKLNSKNHFNEREEKKLRAKIIKEELKA